jgi:hypothetical protein
MNNKENYFSQPLKNIINPSKLNILNKKDKDIILFNLRKISEDINKMELFFSTIDLKPADVLRSKQFIINNKNRVKKCIWTISGSEIEDSDLE